MGRKSSAKSQAAPPAGPPSAPPRRSAALVVCAAIAVLLGVGALAYLRRADAVSPPAASQTTSASAAAQAAAAIPANLKAHPQETLPALQFPGYPTPRPPDVVRAAYRFAAEHPEVLSYVPCFCGCERSGHRGNEDCFVRERDVNGDVIAWEDHGMECAVCLDVAQRSMQLFASGKSVRDIRATIEREWAGRMPSHTPTPAAPGPPAAHNH
jgi:uncharacterized protein with PCYCGC motif